MSLKYTWYFLSASNTDIEETFPEVTLIVDGRPVTVCCLYWIVTYKDLFIFFPV
jgi:hypothetical protein